MRCSIRVPHGSRSACWSRTISTTVRRREPESSPASAWSRDTRWSSSPTTRRSRPVPGGRRRSARFSARRRSRCGSGSRSSTWWIPPGVNLPYQGGVFPGQYGAARIFYYNSIMRRYLNVPQISAVMGSCVAGGAYLPALSDVIFMVEADQLHGAGRPQSREGRNRPGGRCRDPGRCGDAHFDIRRGALPRRHRRRMSEDGPRLPGSPAASPIRGGRSPTRDREPLGSA